MLCESMEKNEMATLKTGNTMIRAMFRAKEKRISQKLNDLLGLQETLADRPKQTECDGMGRF